MLQKNLPYLDWLPASQHFHFAIHVANGLDFSVEKLRLNFGHRESRSAIVEPKHK